jgi:hypothetical protein
MTRADRGNEKVKREAAGDLRVRDVMLSAPKTLSADAGRAPPVIDETTAATGETTAATGGTTRSLFSLGQACLQAGCVRSVSAR